MQEDNKKPNLSIKEKFLKNHLRYDKLLMSRVNSPSDVLSPMSEKIKSCTGTG